MSDADLVQAAVLNEIARHDAALPTPPPSLLEAPGVHFFIGRLDGEPVAIAQAVVQEGVVGAYGVATAPAHRRRGDGEALSWRATLAQPELPAVLEPSPMAAAMYARMGYREIGRHHAWLRDPDRPARHSGGCPRHPSPPPRRHNAGSAIFALGPWGGTVAATISREAARAYAGLEERILERDQVGASAVVYDLIKQGRPLAEMLGETIRIHAPYTHMPYHQRIDAGVVRFVNNDHCLLSARATLNLRRLVPSALEYLPLAQTLWYVPTGLDPWNQLLGKMPGHYARRTYDPAAHDTLAPPVRHWPDQDPLPREGDFDEGMNEWLTLVQRGEVIDAYRLFLGLFQEEAERPRLLAQLVFAGLIDVQDRMLWNRSYTTGHKSYRARATVELGDAVGWDNAHHVLYAGVPDIGVGPRWYSAYEMACQISMNELEDEAPASSLEATGASDRDAQLFANTAPLTPPEALALRQALTDAPEPAYIDQITALLLAGRSPVHILEEIQIAAASVVMEAAQPDSFSMPQHGYEYVNTLRWFYDRFEHPHRVKLLYVAGSFINQCAQWLRNSPGNGARLIRAPKQAASLARGDILQRLDDAMVHLAADEAVAWVQAYLDGDYPRGALVQTLALGAAKQGNDPHNQEIGLCLLEDYLKTASPDRDTLLLACAKHTAGHRKYGDPLEAYRRFADAFSIETTQWTEGDGDPADALLDDIVAELVE